MLCLQSKQVACTYNSQPMWGADEATCPCMLYYCTSTPAVCGRTCWEALLTGRICCCCCRRDPKSRQVLSPDAQLVPNMDLYRAIEDWAAEKQAALLLTQRAAAAAGLEGSEGLEGLDQQAGRGGDAADDEEENAQQPVLAAAARRRPQRSSSSAGAGAVCSGLLAAARGAAAGLAAVRQAGSQSLGRVTAGMAGTAAAAAGNELAREPDGYHVDDDDVGGPLLSDEEVEGPARRPAAAAAAAVRRVSRSVRQQRSQRQQQDAEDADQAADDGQGAAAAASSGRYALRRRSRGPAYN
jgi:hypothetical protein